MRVCVYAHTYFLHEQNLAQNQLTFILVRWIKWHKSIHDLLLKHTDREDSRNRPDFSFFYYDICTSIMQNLSPTHKSFSTLHVIVKIKFLLDRYKLSFELRLASEVLWCLPKNQTPWRKGYHIRKRQHRGLRRNFMLQSS